MFQSVGSRVAEGIKQFKTYHPYKKKDKLNDEGLNNLINKVQEEIKQKENENVNNIQQQSNQVPVPIPA